MTDDPILTPRAFPSHGEWLYSGMTLRDWFAGQALIAALGVAQEWAEDEDKDMWAKNIDITPQFIARQAYKMADAMLIERAKP